MSLRGFLDDLTEKPLCATALIFADWLDDNGEPERAALIREKCARRGAPLVKLAAWPAYRAVCDVPDSCIYSTANGLITGIRTDAKSWECYGVSWVSRHPISLVLIRDAEPYYDRDIGQYFIPIPFGLTWLPATLQTFFSLKQASRYISNVALQWARSRCND